MKELTILCNDPEEILSQEIDRIKEEMGADYSPGKVNLAELERRTGITRGKLRRLQKNNFEFLPNGNKGKKHEVTVISGYTGVIDDLLKKGVSNSQVIFERIAPLGYAGSLTTVKTYIGEHKDLIPARRQLTDPQGNRGRRFETGPGESYQMDWGFVDVFTQNKEKLRFACFAMVCHHCGMMYIEFFPNARQESLFIGMIHAFMYMGVPETVLTDNMKSVVITRDTSGKPIFQKDYEQFMKTVGFKTKLCKPRHPFTKGKVERLVRYVKENFIVGRVFTNITDINFQAKEWCDSHNDMYHRSLDLIPSEAHHKACLSIAKILTMDIEVYKYLCPLRKISFDGFVNYEGRRFGVPYSYKEKTCRIARDGFYIYIYDASLTMKLATHNVTWSRKDSYTADQYVSKQPEELPSTAVKAFIELKNENRPKTGFEKFDFSRRVNFDE